MNASRTATAVWAWAIFLVAMGTYWTFGGAGYPFGRNDVDGPTYTSLLGGLEHHAGGPVIAVVGALAGLIAVPLQEKRRRAGVLPAVTVLALLVIVVVADARTILLLPPLGLFPIIWFTATWPTVFQMVLVAGAALLLVAGVRYARRTGPARPSRPWIKIGVAATVVAMICPMPYAVIRLAWSQGWGLGAPEPFVASTLRNQPENVYIEPVLASFALGGALLTLGLLCRWGRIFPRWIPVLRGRAVPLWFPLGLGGSAAIGIFGFGRAQLLGQLGYQPPGALDTFQLWGQPIHDTAYWGAGGLGWIFFPLWAISLAVALIGYYHRALRCSGSPEPAGPGSRAGWSTRSPRAPRRVRAGSAAPRR
jgi:hypothetical protein